MVTPTNRIAKRAAVPTPEEIQQACRNIRANWTLETETQRRVHYRVDQPHLLMEAQLRFLSFLIARSNGQLS